MASDSGKLAETIACDGIAIGEDAAAVRAGMAMNPIGLLGDNSSCGLTVAGAPPDANIRMYKCQNHNWKC